MQTIESKTAELAVQQPAVITPMAIIQTAMDQGVDIDRLRALMELQERWEANEARKAYYAAMKQFKDNAPIIHKTGVGHNNKPHTELDHACDQIIPALAK